MGEKLFHYYSNGGEHVETGKGGVAFRKPKGHFRFFVFQALQPGRSGETDQREVLQSVHCLRDDRAFYGFL